VEQKINRLMGDYYADFAQRGAPVDQVLHFNETAVTRGEFAAGVAAMEARLTSAGIGRGTVVGYSLPNCPEAFYLFIALARLGACAVPLFPMIPDQAKAMIYKNARASFVITLCALESKLREAATQVNAGFALLPLDGPWQAAVPAPGAPAAGGLETLPFVFASSSGTTGRPKLVCMTQANAAALIHAAIEMALPLFGVDGGGYSSAIAFPLSTAGMLNCCGTLFAGVRLIFSADLSPVRFMQLVTRWRADSLSAPPAYFEAILSLPMLDTFLLTTVRRIMTGMDFFSPSLLERLRARFPNIDSAANGYGLIETTNVFMIARAMSREELTGSLSRMRLPAGSENKIEVRGEGNKIVPAGDTGELWVSGKSVVRGYLGNPEETAAAFVDGWFATGDIVRNEGDGSVSLLGRKKYLIKRGGKSVSPVQVEDCINAVPGVKTSAVVGVPHRLYGEMVWAFIVGLPGAGPDLKTVMQHLRAALANYMVPDQLSFLDDIPKNPGAGKVDYEKLKTLALAELAKEGEPTDGQ
jgi:acyl-CoA synthetase (AMP-forming)/AMP-acid ligase II